MGLGLAIVGAGCGSQTTPVPPVEKAPVTAPSDTPVNTAPAPQAEDQKVSATSSDSNSAVTSTAPDSSTSQPTSMAPSAPLAFPGVLPESAFAKKFVHLQTTKGEIVFELLPKEGPNAASNFVYLTNQKFYDGLTFHRVVPGFVIQGGDPLGTGTGGPGYEFKNDPVKLPYDAGIVAMANAGRDTNGSQFFIMLENNPLPPDYSVFGRVVKGLDVVRKIGVGDRMTTVTLDVK